MKRVLSVKLFLDFSFFLILIAALRKNRRGCEAVKKNLTKRKLQSLESRKRIFEAAISLIRKKGFDQVTIEEICAKAKVSKGLFYNYFSSKDQIVVEQFLEIDKYYIDIAEGALKNYRGMEKLLNFVGFQMKFGKSNIGKDLLRHLYRSLIMTSKRGHAILDEKRFLYTFLNKTVKEAQEMGELSGHLKSEEIARHIAVLMRGVFYNWCLHERDFNIEKSGPEIISTFLKGLSPLRSSSPQIQK
jgi:AcrR family transcriptional regulator